MLKSITMVSFRHLIFDSLKQFKRLTKLPNLGGKNTFKIAWPFEYYNRLISSKNFTSKFNIKIVWKM